MTSQPRDKTRDSTKHDTAKFGIDLYYVPCYSIIVMIILWHGCNIMVHVVVVNVEVIILKYMDLWFS